MAAEVNSWQQKKQKATENRNKEATHVNTYRCLTQKECKTKRGHIRPVT